MSTPLIELRDLKVRFPTASGDATVVKGVSFDLGQERLGIVGESGSGKSMIARSILKLVQCPGQVEATRLSFCGRDLMALTEKEMRKVRGAGISMIMQDPKFSLNPTITIGDQIAEALVAHEKMSRRKAYPRVLEMLTAVRIDDPARVARLYPHQISGGMGQRAMIAMMLIPRPQVLIADEPTSALDMSVQAQVLDLIDQLVRENNMGLILISHDLPLVSRFCDRIMVMKAGQVVETCRAADLSQAQHPYTRGLLAALPRLPETRKVLPVLDRRGTEAT